MKGFIIQEPHSLSSSALLSLLERIPPLTQYNWLISDIMAYPTCAQYGDIYTRAYVWLSGEALSDWLRRDHFHWIWAVFSGFRPDVPLEEILHSRLPYANGYAGFWTNPLTLQHPLSEIEIAAWDGECALVIGKHSQIIAETAALFPAARDLEVYNNA